MTESRHVQDHAADQYVERTRAISTIYGCVGDLTPEEEARVREMYLAGRHTREAAEEVLKMRDAWPAEPDPRQTYDQARGARGLPSSDGFGRVTGRRRRGR